MRFATAFKRILALPAASVATVSFTDEGLVLGLRRRRRRLVCPCGRRSRSRYDSSRRWWRHLDFGTPHLGCLNVDPADAEAYLKAWCTSALRSRIKAFTNLVRRIRKHFDAIIAAIRLGLSNSRLEGINAKIRLIQRRGFGIRDVDSLTAMIYICLGGITIDLPT